MSRGRVSWAVQRQRDVLQQQRADERFQRDRDRAAREAERQRLRLDKARVKEYADSRAKEAEELSNEVRADADRMSGLLHISLQKPTRLDFNSLKVHPPIAAFDAGALRIQTSPPDPATFQPAKLGSMAGLMPGAKSRHAEAARAGDDAYVTAKATWDASDQARLVAFEAARNAYDGQVAAAQAEAAARDAEVAAFELNFEAGDPNAVGQYFSLVLDGSDYPHTFPRKRRVAYVPDSKQLVVEVEFPPADIIPTAREYRYVRNRDDIDPITRPIAQSRSRYADLICQMTLRTVSELLRADYPDHVDTLVVNGFVNTIDPATEMPKAPYLITLRVSRAAFLALDLMQVDPMACLKKLNAGVSRSPADLEPVRPVVEFNMVDSRFVEETDVLSTLDQRPNLMELSPQEFENLITNLFGKMGLETRQTQASRDGGVDCVAWDNRPILGGKVIIQAKRYKNTVGVSAVRDLFGTLQNEGASKGILVTTSGYGAASFEFASGKPLELLSGANLLALLEDHAGIQARIEPPEEWVDPVPDMPFYDPVVGSHPGAE
jgi:restriction system protein